AEHEPRSKAFTVKREHQPPCLGATISTSSAGANWVAERATAATTLPFTAVAIFASAKPSRAQSSSSVFASVAKASPLSRIFKKHLRVRRAGLELGGDQLLHDLGLGEGGSQVFSFMKFV